MTIKIKAGSNVSSYAVMTGLRSMKIFHNNFESVIFFLNSNFTIYERSGGKKGISRYNKYLVKLLKNGYHSLSEVEWKKLEQTIVQHCVINRDVFDEHLNEFCQLTQYAFTYERKLKNGAIKKVNDYALSKKTIFNDLKQIFFYSEPLKQNEEIERENMFGMIFDSYEDFKGKAENFVEKHKAESCLYIIKRPTAKEIVSDFIMKGETKSIQVLGLKDVDYEFFQ